MKNKKLFRVFGTITTAYFIWLSLLYIIQGTLFFPKWTLPDLSQMSIPEDVEQGWINPDPETQVEYWYIKSKTKGKSPIIVVFHGNASAIDFTYKWVKPLTKMGFNILIPEYRGYGRSTGTPSQENVRYDMKEILKTVLVKPEVDPNRLVYFGESLGGGVALDLTRSIKPSAIILRSTFESGVKMASGYLAPEFLMKNPFKSSEVVKRFEGPIFIAHGRLDRTVPFSHGETLRDIAKSPVFYPVDSDHNDFPMDIQFWQSVATFLTEGEILQNNIDQR